MSIGKKNCLIIISCVRRVCLSIVEIQLQREKFHSLWLTYVLVYLAQGFQNQRGGF
jgi:hypothetical protein